MFKSTLAKITITVCAVLMMFAATSCYVPRATTDTKDLSYIYNPSKSVFTPYITVFDQDEETSVLSIYLRKRELYFTEANTQGIPLAVISVKAYLYDQSIGGQLVDTLISRYNITKEEAAAGYVCKLPLKTYEGKSYSVVIKIVDIIRQRTHQAFIDFDRKGPYDRYNFKIRDNFSHSELYTRTIHKDQFVNVLYPAKRPDTLWLMYYDVVKKAPVAPSVLLPEVTATDEPVRTIPLVYSDTLPLMFPRQGIYLLSVDSMRREGLTLFNFGTEYPTMITPESMIPPLTYLATPEEMDTLIHSDKPKLALDNFWLARTGSIERSKELIKIYYNRTLYANYYFTSYKEGWLTDRGMVYIIYGPPDKLYKTNEGENWGYKKTAKKSKWGSGYTVEDEYLWFTFRRQANIFTDNDFTLNRALTPVSYWDVAVARWREGKVFRLDNPEELQ